MKFFSGFSLKNESSLFTRYVNSSDYTVCGFSYGSIKALESVKEQLKNGRRVDRLQLFSPVFFETKSEKFKKLQLFGYKKDKVFYLKQFIESCFYPYGVKTIEQKENSFEELSELLNYKWVKPELVELINLGVNIEVYLGSKDKIIDVESAREFFLDVATVTYLKEANHFLQID